MHRLQAKSVSMFLKISILFSVLSVSCMALARVDNNVRVAQPDGTHLTQVANDTQFRLAGAFSPDGKIFACSGKQPPDDITLIDANGRLIANIDLHADSAITELKRITPTLLCAREHINPNASRFHFVSIGPSNTISAVSPPEAEGGTCMASPDGKDMACAIADWVSINGRDVYYTTNPFLSATTLQTVNIAVGTGISTSTSPSFRVEVKDISSDKRVHLGIVRPDGVESDPYVATGEETSETYEDDTHPLADYAFKPVFTSNPGVIRLYVMKSNTGAYSFEGDIAWDSRGKRLAIVESNRLGQRTWVLLNREMGRAANKGEGAIDAKEPLPIDGPVKSIVFTSDTHIRIEGATQIFDKDIPAQGKVPAGMPYTITTCDAATTDSECWRRFHDGRSQGVDLPVKSDMFHSCLLLPRVFKNVEKF